jgi:hypothetical protein
MTHDNLIFKYLNKIPGFQTNVNIFLKNSKFKKETKPCWSPEILEKLFKPLKTVPPTN